MITLEHLKALREFCSDYNFLDGTLADIRFASSKHFEMFTEKEREDLCLIVHFVLSGLAICRDINK